jgi:hypothetical protein
MAGKLFKKFYATVIDTALLKYIYIFSGLPRIFGLVTAACTYEGENTVLQLQIARYFVYIAHIFQ